MSTENLCHAIFSHNNNTILRKNERGKEQSIKSWLKLTRFNEVSRNHHDLK